MHCAKAYKQYTHPANLFNSFYADDGQLLNRADARSHMDQRSALDTLQVTKFPEYVDVQKQAKVQRGKYASLRVNMPSIWELP